MQDEESPQKLVPSLALIRRLLPFAKESGRYLPVALLLLLVMAYVQVVLPQIMRLAIDGPLSLQSDVDPETRFTEVKHLGQLFLGFLSVGFVSNYLSTWLLQKFGQTLVLNLRGELFAKLHRLPIPYFDKNAVGRTTTRVVNDSNSLSELFTSVLAAGIGDLILVLGILLVLLASDPLLSLILALFCPILFAVIAWFRNRSTPLYKAQRALLAQINAFFAELLDGLSTVKSFQAESFQKDRFTKRNQAFLDNEIELLSLIARFRPSFEVSRTAATACLLTIGGYTVLEGYSTIGTLVSSLLYVRLLFAPLEQLAERYNILLKASVASERVVAILDLDEEWPKNAEREQLPQTKVAARTLRFENVSYHYSEDKPVLKNVSFTLAPGKSIALVGPTGSGKSTIVSLLLGFYRLDLSLGHKGRILVDEVPLEDCDIQAWRRSLAFVSQDLFLFKASISQNVGLYQELGPEKVNTALSRAACDEFVSQLPEGSKTIVGERGHGLSTGQRQLLSFARALAFEPDLLILDEATANIDSETEARMEKVLDTVLSGQQAIIVAHRLSTVRRADLILVLSEGEICEQGSHTELMSIDGVYANMIRKGEQSKERL